MTLRDHLRSLPTDLRDALDETYRSTIEHWLREEWDDAQVDAGRFCEAVLRYLEWKIDGTYTAIDGKSKPNRGKVVGAAKNNAKLETSLRAQVPMAAELVMDIRNNRNSAHLGHLRPSRLDAACVRENVTWIVGEIARIESTAEPRVIQQLLDELAERHLPLVQRVEGRPVVLNPDLTAAQKALVLLYQTTGPVPINTLRQWAEYTHTTQWRKTVIARLHREKLVHLDADGVVHLLRPGELKAQEILLAHSAAAAA